MAARSVQSPGCRSGNPAAEGGCGHPPLQTCARRGGRPQGSPLRVGAVRYSCWGGLYDRPFCPIPRVPEREPRGRGRMWASAPTDVRPAGRATTRVAPTCWGRPVFLLGWPLWPPVLSNPQGAGAGMPTAEGGYGHPPLRTCARRGGRPQGSPLRVWAARRSCRGRCPHRPAPSSCRRGRGSSVRPRR